MGGCCVKEKVAKDFTIGNNYLASYIRAMKRPIDQYVPQWVVSTDNVREAAYRSGHRSLAALAGRIGISRQALYDFLRRGSYTTATLSRLCYYCEGEPRDLLEQQV